MKNGYRFGKWFVFDKNTKKSMDITYDLESMDIDSSYIKTNVISYYTSGEKMNEYFAHSYRENSQKAHKHGRGCISTTFRA